MLLRWLPFSHNHGVQLQPDGQMEIFGNVSGEMYLAKCTKWSIEHTSLHTWPNFSHTCLMTTDLPHFPRGRPHFIFFCYYGLLRVDVLMYELLADSTTGFSFSRLAKDLASIQVEAQDG